MFQSPYPVVGGRRYLGMCRSIQEAQRLAALYRGVVEKPGIRLLRDGDGRYADHAIEPEAYSVFLDWPPFGAISE